MDEKSCIKKLEENNNHKILRRVDLDDYHIFSKEECKNQSELAVIDVETTGFSPNLGDKIIDIAIAICKYDKQTGQILGITRRYESLENPEFNIPKEITNLTGITNEMVKEKKIDDYEMTKVLDNVNLIICHNSSFDRPFLEYRFPAFANKNFACSLKEIPWASWGITSSKLDYIGFKYNFFHEAHRARADVDMLIVILNSKDPKKKEYNLSYLLNEARSESWIIYALDLAYEKRHNVKSKGYRWNNGEIIKPSCWWKETKNKDLEIEFLNSLGCSNPKIKRLTAKDRYREVI